jgi:hypothetical protein
MLAAAYAAGLMPDGEGLAAARAIAGASSFPSQASARADVTKTAGSSKDTATDQPPKLEDRQASDWKDSVVSASHNMAASSTEAKVGLIEEEFDEDMDGAGDDGDDGDDGDEDADEYDDDGYEDHDVRTRVIY